MVTVKQKTVVTQILTGDSKSHSLTEVKSRDVSSVIDEPAERGGTNKGLTPTETLMAALIGCTNVIFHKTAHANGVHVHALNIRLESHFDRRGVTLQEEIAVPFPKITMYIDLKTDADDAKVAEATRQLNMFCPISKVIRASGSELEEIWRVERPGSPLAEGFERFHALSAAARGLRTPGRHACAVLVDTRRSDEAILDRQVCR